MSDYEYEDDDDYGTESNNDLVKQLRKANKQKEKELADLKSQFDNLSKAQRERVVQDVLSSRGVNPKIAKFIPQDIDSNEESLSKWLEDNADIFGFQVDDQPKTTVDSAHASEYKRLTATADQGLTPDSIASLEQKILGANSKEELDEIIRLAGL